MAKLNDPTLIQELNNQFTFERYSADVYYALATALDTLNLVGFKKFMETRSAEEREHAKKFADYMADRSVLPIIDALPRPAGLEAVGVMDAGARAFAAALDHELQVTERINNLYILAEESEDPATCEFLRWFITEQVEEERTLDEWMTRFTLAAGDGAAILDLDRELR